MYHILYIVHVHINVQVQVQVRTCSFTCSCRCPCTIQNIAKITTTNHTINNDLLLLRSPLYPPSPSLPPHISVQSPVPSPHLPPLPVKSGSSTYVVIVTELASDMVLLTFLLRDARIVDRSVTATTPYMSIFLIVSSLSFFPPYFTIEYTLLAFAVSLRNLRSCRYWPFSKGVIAYLLSFISSFFLHLEWLYLINAYRSIRNDYG